MTQRRLFKDRRAAGRALAKQLAEYAAANPVVLALPRGGVPVAFEVAKKLDAPLDLVMVRKIGLPGYDEIGIGALVDGSAPQVVMNDDLVARLQPNMDAIRETIRREAEEIERRRSAYLADRDPVDIRSRVVIMVDDGIATGATVKAALRAIRKAGPKSVILAVPLAPREAMIELSLECDQLVHLKTPFPFGAVGAHYDNFEQTSDEEVIALLDAARAFGQREPA